MNRLRILIPLLVLFAAACSQTETTIIRSPAIVPSTVTNVGDEEASTRPSTILHVAELVGIESFDPLIARTSADLRNIQLVYEGLMRLDASGTPVPALASQVDVSADSLTYTIRLRDNAFYHNDPAFSNGIGRKVNANDVVAVFERMTRRDVPETAASLFNTVITGFDLRNRENRDVYIPTLRQTTGITGIERVDSRTVRFRLTAPDRFFLHRLASPLASIYAPETVTVMGQRPVGSGPYRFQTTSGDTLVTFVLNSAHPDTAQFRIRRVDVRRLASETRAYRSMMLGDVDVIAESGPVLAIGILDLNPETVNVIRFGIHDQVSMRLNPDNFDGLTLQQGIGWFQRAWSDSLRQEFSRAGYDLTFMAMDGLPPSVRTSAFKLTEHPHEDQTSRRMVLHLRNYGQVDLLKGYAVSRVVTFHSIVQARHFPSQEMVSPYDLIRFDVRGYRLTHPAVSGVGSVPHSWWFDLRGVSLTR